MLELGRDRGVSPAPALAARMAGSHGDLPRWLEALAALPRIEAGRTSYGACVRVAGADPLDADRRAALVASLEALRPWRKGPFDLFGVRIDAEWQSDLKWGRIAPHVDLKGARVLDVGCGNGYYGWRMLEAGAASVTGIDPSRLFVLQHALIAHYLRDARNLVLPLTVEALEPRGAFDVVFSMGVLYHRRDPAAHVRALARHADATLVVESLVVDDAPLVAPKRYARMRNVHVVPTVPLLRSWLEAAGFGRVRLVDRTATTVIEQRSTPWMTFESLAEALDPAHPTRTVEGYPAPERAVMIATR